MEAGFIPGGQGALFYVHFPPERRPVRGAVLHVHAFADEMNKSRRMVACQARRFAAAGYGVLVSDHFGSGDSEGDFGEATWEGWIDDLHRAVGWLAQHYPGPPVLWGLRTGCLLLSEFLGARQVQPAATLLWQPVVNGEQFLVHFLRLRMAAGMMSGKKESTADMRATLGAGEPLEVAGYMLSPAMASALTAARLAPPPGGPVHWLEVVLGEDARLAPASQRVADAWTASGCDLQTGAVLGDPFWSTQEIAVVPALLEQTTRRFGASA